MRHAVFHSFSSFFIVFAFAMIWRYHWSSLHFFPCLMGFSLSFSLNFHVHLWSTAKLNCLSLRRWTMLAMPGWQASRIAPLDGHANAGSCWHLPDEIRCPGCPPVDAPARWWGQWLCLRALQADGVRLRFRIFSMEEKHGKTLDPLAEVHVLSQVEWHMFPVTWSHHHISNESICWGALTRSIYVDISYLLEV